MKELYDQVSIACSRLTTRAYSTSFSLGIKCLGKELRTPLYSIYGFVRFADEIVDTFHDYDKAKLLEKFKEDTYRAIDARISTNPILHSFQLTVNHFGIDRSLIHSFLNSMAMDLHRKSYSPEDFKEYILGSAEVVGLMCLRVFCKHNDELYTRLTPYAMSLGSAFQKINFLRDLKADYVGMGRVYFPGVDMTNFTQETKKSIEESIAQDLHSAYKGITQLPRSSRFGVYVAYVYYLALFKKIKNTSYDQILQGRIRIHNPHKARLLAYSYFKHQFNML